MLISRKGHAEVLLSWAALLIFLQLISASQVLSGPPELIITRQSRKLVVGQCCWDDAPIKRLASNGQFIITK